MTKFLPGWLRRRALWTGAESNAGEHSSMHFAVRQPWDTVVLEGILKPGPEGTTMQKASIDLQNGEGF